MAVGQTVYYDSSRSAVIPDPDCMRCMHEQLRADGIVVFFRQALGWRLASFSAFGNVEELRIAFNRLIDNKQLDRLASLTEGFRTEGDAALQELLNPIPAWLFGKAVIGGPVRRAGAIGVRLAWRSAAEPFVPGDQDIVECFGNCPEGCRSADQRSTLG